jgi:hypothetical protein
VPIAPVLVEEGVRRMSVGLDALWSGTAGAILVALFTVGYTEVKESRQRVRARMGYARLLEAEIEANGRVAEIISHSPDVSWKDLAAGYWLSRPPSVEAWKEARAPLAALIRSEDFERLDAYYRLIGVFIDLKEHPPATEQPTALTARGVSSDPGGRHTTAQEHAVQVRQPATPDVVARLLSPIHRDA